MTAFVTILSLLFFPLNILLFSPALFQNSKVTDVSPLLETKDKILENKGEVRGIEKSQEEKLFFNNTVVPLRKEGFPDLFIANAHSSIILDVDSGTILHYNQGKQRRPIASLTKLMTAVLVVEKISDLESEIITISQAAVHAEGTKIGCPRSGYCVSSRLQVGEKISALNLLKAMLINSANDAAIALAVHTAGSEEKFVEMMNKKAKSLEINDTRFCTSSGLDVEGRENECYSTAYDIARIAIYSMKYDLIWDFFQLPSGTEIFSVDGKKSYQLINTVLASETIPNCLGGKTGFTHAAGHCLLVAASDSSQKHRVVAVVLNDPYRWQDIKKMLNWTFSSHEWR